MSRQDHQTMSDLPSEVIVPCTHGRGEQHAYCDCGSLNMHTEHPWNRCPGGRRFRIDIEAATDRYEAEIGDTIDNEPWRSGNRETVAAVLAAALVEVDDE